MRKGLILIIGFYLLSTFAAAGTKGAKKVQPAKPTTTAKATPPSAQTKSVDRKPAAIDPNQAVEVRGQARNLSMMLVLKNGKDNINFIKERKDFQSEIKDTPF